MYKLGENSIKPIGLKLEFDNSQSTKFVQCFFPFSFSVLNCVYKGVCLDTAQNNCPLPHFLCETLDTLEISRLFREWQIEQGIVIIRGNICQARLRWYIHKNYAKQQYTATSRVWAWPSSAQAGIVLYFTWWTRNITRLIDFLQLSNYNLPIN